MPDKPRLFINLIVSIAVGKTNDDGFDIVAGVLGGQVRHARPKSIDAVAKRDLLRSNSHLRIVCFVYFALGVVTSSFFPRTDELIWDLSQKPVLRLSCDQKYIAVLQMRRSGFVHPVRGCPNGWGMDK